MAAISDIHNVWRDALVPASFRGVVFHVETSQRGGGRRTVVHEYPKRNQPYAEDMGRHAIRWTFTGYLIHFDHIIGGNLLTQIRDLNRVLDDDDAGMLIHPLLGTMLCMCERWSYSDHRTRGGYIEYDMQFIEAGAPALQGFTDTQANLEQSAQSAEENGAATLKNDTQALQNVPLPQARPAAAPGVTA